MLSAPPSAAPPVSAPPAPPAAPTALPPPSPALPNLCARSPTRPKNATPRACRAARAAARVGEHVGQAAALPRRVREHAHALRPRCARNCNPDDPNAQPHARPTTLNRQRHVQVRRGKRCSFHEQLCLQGHFPLSREVPVLGRQRDGLFSRAHRGGGPRRVRLHGRQCLPRRHFRRQERARRAAQGLCRREQHRAVAARRGEPRRRERPQLPRGVRLRPHAQEWPE